MKIIVLVKEVPDTYGERRLELETGLVDRAAVDAVLDEIGERAVELALSAAEAHEGTEVVVLALAPASAEATIRKALAMGADRAIHITDPDLVGADLGLTAEALAAAIEREGCSLVIAGSLSTDGASGMLPAMLAEHLGLPHATGLSTVEIGDAAISGERPVDGAVQRISVPLPAVISITEALPEGRFPNFKGVLAAKKKPIETLGLADLGDGIDPLASPRTIMLAVAETPPRAAGSKIVDDGDAAQHLADFLIENRLA